MVYKKSNKNKGNKYIDNLNNPSRDKSFLAKTLLTVKAGPPAYGGYTLGRIPPELSAETAAKIILIRGAIPGETVEILIDEEKKDYYLAHVVEIIDPSPARVALDDPVTRDCIGCQLHYIAYDEQVKIKEEVLSDTMRRIGGIEVELSEPLILTNNTWNYRYRAQFKVAGGKIGFYKEKTNEVVDTDYAPLVIHEINEALKKCREALFAHPDKLSTVAELHISYGNGAFALIKTNPRTKAPKAYFDELANLLLDCCFKGVVIETGGMRGGKSFERYTYGKEHLTLPLGDIKYTVSPWSFFQANWRLNEVMVEHIKGVLGPLHGKRVLDLYSGAGNFSLPLAASADEIVAVEENPSAIEDGKRNLRINGIKNMRFSHSPAETYNIANYGPFHTVILDPPRGGLSDKVIANIQKARPKHIVYISCNPSTLARDIKRLGGTYRIESIRLVDLFPQTYHIETLAFLQSTK